METTTHEYAGFWARFAAYLIDMAVVAFLSIHVLWFFKEQMEYSLAAHRESLRVLGHWFSDEDSTYKLVDKLAYYYALFWGMLFPWVYYAGFESSTMQGTPGKYVLGIYVTDLDNKRLTFANATGRYFAKIISGIILGIGYLMAGWSEKKQAMHDTIAGCYVWRK